jgi:hypothetical protein
MLSTLLAGDQEMCRLTDVARGLFVRCNQGWPQAKLGGGSFYSFMQVWWARAPSWSQWIACVGTASSFSALIYIAK